MTPDHRSRLLALAGRVWAIRAYSHREPHVFAEDKDLVAREIVAFANEISPVDALLTVNPQGQVQTEFRSSIKDRRGRKIVVERRARLSRIEVVCDVGE